MRSDQVFGAVDEVLLEGLSFLQTIQGGELVWGGSIGRKRCHGAYFADRDRAFRLIVTDVGGVVVRGV